MTQLFSGANCWLTPWQVHGPPGAAQSASAWQERFAVSGRVPLMQQACPATPPQLAWQVAPPGTGWFWKTEVVVMAMWKSMGSRPFWTRTWLVLLRLVTKAPKLCCSDLCSPPIDPESSTTKRMSAVEMSDSVTRSVPGWIRHWLTGLKL